MLTKEQESEAIEHISRIRDINSRQFLIQQFFVESNETLKASIYISIKLGYLPLDSTQVGSYRTHSSKNFIDKKYLKLFYEVFYEGKFWGITDEVSLSKFSIYASRDKLTLIGGKYFDERMRQDSKSCRFYDLGTRPTTFTMVMSSFYIDINKKERVSLTSADRCLGYSNPNPTIPTRLDHKQMEGGDFRMLTSFGNRAFKLNEYYIGLNLPVESVFDPLEEDARRSLQGLTHTNPAALMLLDKSVMTYNPVTFKPARIDGEGNVCYIPFNQKDKSQPKEVKVTPQKYIKMLLKNKSALKDGYVNDAHIDEIGNLIKSSMKVEIEIVEGPMISKIYNVKPMSLLKGTIGGSCMRGMPLKTFKMYESDAKMLIVKHSGLIVARAILWEDVVFDAKIDGDQNVMKFMDRVYNSRPEFEKIVFKWAEENGYVRKAHQSHSAESSFHYKGKTFTAKIKKELKIKVNDLLSNKEEVKSFKLGQSARINVPYLDTFSNLAVNEDKLELTNYESKGSKGRAHLKNTGGYSAIH